MSDQNPAQQQQDPLADTQSVSGSQAFQNYIIPEETKEKFPKLIPLIVQTESMSDDEKNYWFQSLPIMEMDQVKSLAKILLTEKKQLEQINKEYQDEIATISQNGLEQWHEFENSQKREVNKQKIQSTEAQHRKQDQQEQENLLKELENL